MTQDGHERFGSRLGMMLAMLGMAVGTGNIWRFPRIAASNGGGTFLVAWIVFLFLWSIPLILLEFGMGRKTRSGPVRAFLQMMGPRWAWMGAFVVFVTTAISFYYSVVAGWTVRYAAATLTGEIPETVPGSFWDSWTSSPWPIVTHGLMFGLAAYVVSHGVKRIEKVALTLMPLLLILVIAMTVRALFLDGASAGVSYLFTVDWDQLAEPRIWIEALTQNAWDTGAGWGLVLCYAAYMREKEDTALNAFVIPTGNNLISLMAGLMIFSTVFSVIPNMIAQPEEDRRHLEKLSPELAKAVKEGEEFSPKLVQRTVFDTNNEGLTFTWMPQLFETVRGGRAMMFFFFVALSFAAFTSLIAMVEVATRTLIDAGMTRPRAICAVGVTGFLLGIPSALSMRVFQNQDWVWGVALMLSGLFFAIAVIKNGVSRFRDEQLNHEDSNIHIGRWWDVVVSVLIPLQALVLLGWWLYSSAQWSTHNWWNPFDTQDVQNVGTVLFQCGVVMLVLILLNRWIVRRMSGK